jgi:hypothetical protein
MWLSSTTTKVKYLKILFSQPAKATSLFFTACESNWPFFRSLRKQSAIFSQPTKATSLFFSQPAKATSLLIYPNVFNRAI